MEDLRNWYSYFPDECQMALCVGAVASRFSSGQASSYYGVALQIDAVLKVIGLTAFSKADALLKTKYNNPKDIILFIGWKTTENRVP